MKKLILASISTLVITACVSQPNPYNQRATTLTDQCNPLERDLTIQWENRYYWCADNYYKKQAVDLQREIARQNAIAEREARKEALLLEKARNAEMKELQKIERDLLKNSPPLKSEEIFIQEKISQSKTVSNKTLSIDSTDTYLSESNSVQLAVNDFFQKNQNTSLVKISGCQLIQEAVDSGFNRAQEAKKILVNKGFLGSIIVEGGQCLNDKSIIIEKI